MTAPARRWQRAFAIVLAAAIAGLAAAQTFPVRPLRLVVPFTPAGASDTVARILAVPLGKALGHNVIVDNRPGGSGTIAADVVTRAPADGHTVFLGGYTYMAHVIMRQRGAGDVLRDFAPVAGVGSNPYMLSVHPSIPARTVPEFIAFARARPGQLSFASSGVGAPMHLAAELFKIVAKVDMVHVPYQGGSPAAVAVMGGHTGVLWSTFPAIIQPVQLGKLRALGVTSTKRVEQFPDVPTIAEAALPGFEVTGVTGMLVPAATPKAAIERLATEVVRTLELAEVRGALARDGYAPAPMGPAELDAVLKAKVEQIRRIVADGKLRID